jgi:hypothetical protein
MSKMACLCGGTISDTLVPCPTEGWILRDQDQEQYCDDVCRDLTAFFTAVRVGRRTDWIRKYFSPEYPADVADDGVVHDIIAHHKRRVFLSVAECQQCGRLWVQRESGVNSYRSFVPDESGYAGVLRSGSTQE